MNSKHITACSLSPQIPQEVAALIPALQLREPNTALLKKLSDQEWLDLLAFCDLAHLTLSVARLPADGLPQWVVERLNTNVTDNIKRFKRVKATYKEAAEALSAAGVEHIVIKGFTQCPDYVELPGFRMQSDLDLYCPKEMIVSATTALEKIGYYPDRRINCRSADHGPTMIRPLDWVWRGNSFDPEMPLSIELHFCLWNETSSLFSIQDTELFWGRQTTRTLEDLSFPCLSPVDHLAHLTLHILRNIFSRDWIIHHVQELAFFLHSHANDDGFWKSWSETHESSLRSIEAVAFYYARAWFDCALHQRVENEIENIPLTRQQWLQHFAGSSLETIFHENKDSFWLHLSFLEPSRARRTLFKRLFVPGSIASVNSSAVGLKNRRPRNGGAQPFIQYLIYLGSRSFSYTCLSLLTILRGLRWRFLRYQEGR
jgi:hypothetical protein